MHKTRLSYHEEKRDEEKSKGVMKERRRKEDYEPTRALYLIDRLKARRGKKGSIDFFCSSLPVFEDVTCLLDISFYIV